MARSLHVVWYPGLVAVANLSPTEKLSVEKIRAHLLTVVSCKIRVQFFEHRDFLRTDFAAKPRSHFIQPFLGLSIVKLSHNLIT
jgi:hypothetical protein